MTVSPTARHYGAPVGVYFAFLNNYSNALMPLALVMTVYYSVLRPADWLAYLRGL